MGRYDYYSWYPKTSPKEVKGGIKSQSKSGAFAKKWWGKRWIQVLESFDIGARLQRGRSYARSGQVTKLEITKGCVMASVQGSGSKPYKVIIILKTFNSKEWDKVIDRLNEQSIWLSQLISGEMPDDIESVFSEFKLCLFPEKQNDLETNCTCPDYSNPCKHIAAVYYLMSEAFDNDPFLLFKLRGMEREEFLNRLNKDMMNENVEQFEAEELPLDPNAFWSYSAFDFDYAVQNNTIQTTKHAIIPQRLGNLPFWRSEKMFQETMNKIYTESTELNTGRFDNYNSLLLSEEKRED